MSRRKRRPAKQRRPIRSRKQSVDPNYWQDELERSLNKFGASTCDLPELDRGSCTTEKQHQHAERVRARFLTKQIREIERCSEGEEADEAFMDLMVRAGLVDDGPAWFVIEKQTQKHELTQT